MKKSVVVMIAAVAAGVAFAAQNNALVTFSTRGPDTYADGTTVLDGECYALVWSPDGSTVTFEADGGLKGGKMVLAAPFAKGGRCPKVLFDVDANLYEKELASGTWGVYLLDTRRWDANGNVKPAGTVDGKVRLVNAAGVVTGSDVSLKAGAISASSVSEVAAAASASAVPADAPKPTITGIRVDGANVYVTVKGTVPYLQYGLTSGETPDAVTDQADGAKQTGAADASDEIILVTPAKKGNAFFKVGRR